LKKKKSRSNFSQRKIFIPKNSLRRKKAVERSAKLKKKKKKISHCSIRFLSSPKKVLFSAKDAKCLYDQSKTYNVETTAQYVKPNSTHHVKAALVNSPVAIVIDASSDDIQFYKSGVIRKDCTASSPNHTGLIVGSDKYGLHEAFIVKNSFGTEWDMNGYVLIGTSEKENNGFGVCGILSQPQIVIAKENSFISF